MIFGKASGNLVNIDLTNLIASDGFIIQGDEAGDRAGSGAFLPPVMSMATVSTT